MTITVYRSDDASAPTLTGQVGSLTTVLDALLVNGYGALAAAGWAIAYTATNKRVYRAAAGNRRYLQVDDANTLAAGAQYARTVAYESMSAITTGTAPVPMAGQVSGGLFFQKSQTADATVRPWYAIATGTFFYFCAQAFNTAGVGPTGGNIYPDNFLCFGDFTSKLSGDAYNTLHLAGGVTGNNSSPMSMVLSGTWATIAGHYVMRAYTQIGSSAQVAKSQAKRGISSAPTNLGLDTADPSFPDPITGGMNLSEVYIIESGGGGTIALTRGLFPGLYNIGHNGPSLSLAYNNLDTIAGAGVFAGVTFLLLKLPNGPFATIGYAALQITGTWA